MNNKSKEELIEIVSKLQKEKKELTNSRKFGLVFEDKKEEIPLEISEDTIYFNGFLYEKIGNGNELLKDCLKANGTLKATIKNISGSEILYDIKGFIVMHYENRFYIQGAKTDKKYYPNLQYKSSNIHSEFDSMNYLIEGDNYHALQLLQATHKSLIDVIYIDPPYNTGNQDFKYNDKYVGDDDGYKHSKWLSFMKKRLKLAKNLLSTTGIIFISIDDNEVHRLKLLCDQVFGETNYNGTIVRKENAKKQKIGKVNLKVEYEYALVYKKSQSAEFRYIDNEAYINYEKLCLKAYREFEKKIQNQLLDSLLVL